MEINVQLPLKSILTVPGVLLLQVEEKVPVRGYYCTRVQPFGRRREASATSQQGSCTQDPRH